MGFLLPSVEVEEIPQWRGDIAEKEVHDKNLDDDEDVEVTDEQLQQGLQDMVGQSSWSV